MKKILTDGEISGLRIIQKRIAGYIKIYKSNTISKQIHNTDKHEWKLYEINLNTKEIKIIEIPILKFEPRPNLH